MKEEKPNFEPNRDQTAKPSGLVDAEVAQDIIDHLGLDAEPHEMDAVIATLRRFELPPDALWDRASPKYGAAIAGDLRFGGIDRMVEAYRQAHSHDKAKAREQRRSVRRRRKEASCSVVIRVKVPGGQDIIHNRQLIESKIRNRMAELFLDEDLTIVDPPSYDSDAGGWVFIARGFSADFLDGGE
ncbi:hypothetical protein [Magnetospirillum sp. UT-4]|uniref:hypothetical protein n=1 Tax=Magnetospirillum sp. UT-4 TaxID=2681467 RepID=UPI00137C87F5|nr:hypothetical protein [Magnetospirillum sp. UT-4]CAA7613490.1 hypothetical protein MTBUT4_150015 [Magnetospirillum sp. UT-4]